MSTNKPHQIPKEFDLGAGKFLVGAILSFFFGPPTLLCISFLHDIEAEGEVYLENPSSEIKTLV